MSVVRNSYTWRAGIIKSQLPATTRHVLLTLSCHFNDACEACYPSTRLLAEETGLSERAVITHLANARALGWLRVSKHGFAGQEWARNQYTPSFPQGTEPRSAPCEKGTEPHDKKALNDVQSNYSYELLIKTTTTPSPPRGMEIDDFVESAVWATPPTTSEAGFRRKVRQRIESEGPSPEDRRTLDAWRTWRVRQEEAIQEKERDAQQAAHDQKNRDSNRARLAGAEAFFNGLDEARRGEILANFAEYLAATAMQQPHVLSTFRRTGTHTKIVQVALAEFISTTILRADARETA